MGRPDSSRLPRNRGPETGVGAHDLDSLRWVGWVLDQWVCRRLRLQHGRGLAVVAGDAVGDEPVGGAAIHVEPFARLVGLARVGVRADQNDESWCHPLG